MFDSPTMETGEYGAGEGRFWIEQTQRLMETELLRLYRCRVIRIPVSGHDLRDMNLRTRPQNGVDVYTHAEMLRAYYPHLRNNRILW